MLSLGFFFFFYFSVFELKLKESELGNLDIEYASPKREWFGVLTNRMPLLLYGCDWSQNGYVIACISFRIGNISTRNMTITMLDTRIQCSDRCASHALF